jgi:hypothetical protein
MSRLRQEYLIAPLLCVGVCLALAGCESRQGRPGEYYSQDDGFGIVPPEGWACEEGALGCNVAFQRPPEEEGGESLENIVIFVEPLSPGTTLADYVAASDAKVAELVKVVGPIDRSDATIGGLPAKRYVYSHRMGDRTPRVVQYLLVHNDRGFVISAKAPADTFDTYFEEFEKVIATLQID